MKAVTDSTRERQRQGDPPPRTVDWSPWVYGGDVALDDPAETFHEASALHPAMLDHRVSGGHLLERSDELKATTLRAVKRHQHLPTTLLPGAVDELAGVTLAETIARRRSDRDFGGAPLSLEHLAALLHAAYGVTHRLGETGQPLRAVPSGGALYPLEIYPAVRDVSQLAPGRYHFDPLRFTLEHLRAGDLDAELESLTVYPELFTRSAAVFFITAMFWRTRFKYGQRGYRFALIEAGHAGQNLVLAAAALDLVAVPVGGFFDRRVNEFLRVDGVNEAAIYAVAVGTRSRD